MELLAAISTSATSFTEPGDGGSFVTYAVGSEHRVRFLRSDVTAVSNIAEYSLPSVPSLVARSNPMGLAGHALVGYRRGSDGQWEYPWVSVGQFDDCTAVNLRVLVVQAEVTGTALVFQRAVSFAGRLRLEAVKLVYDARTGVILHTLASSSVEGAEPDDTDLDDEALRAAYEHAPKDARLKVRSFERLLPPGRVFRVDPDTGAVIELRE